MKKDIHPEYVDCTVTCSCGNTFKTRATKPELKIDICNVCHPFYTGTQKLIDTGGRVQRFSDRFGSATEVVKEREAKKKAERAAKLEAEAKAKAEAKAEKAKLKEERAAKFAAEQAKKDEEEAKKQAEEAEQAQAEEGSETAEAQADEAPATEDAGTNEDEKKEAE